LDRNHVKAICIHLAKKKIYVFMHVYMYLCMLAFDICV
jgi:hypothetical protein